MDKAYEKKGKGFAVAALLFFLAATGFTFFGIYLYKSMLNYHPAPNQPEEGDMVSAFAMIFLFGAAAVSLLIALVNLIIFLFKRYRSKKHSDRNKF